MTEESEQRALAGQAIFAAFEREYLDGVGRCDLVEHRLTARRGRRLRDRGDRRGRTASDGRSRGTATVRSTRSRARSATQRTPTCESSTTTSTRSAPGRTPRPSPTSRSRSATGAHAFGVGRDREPDHGVAAGGARAHIVAASRRTAASSQPRRHAGHEGGRMSQMQTWSPERYERNARFVSDLGMPVVELLAPRPGERILDLGCGDGALTAKLVAIGCDGGRRRREPRAGRGRVRARPRLPGRERRGRCRSRGEFDAVFSNAAHALDAARRRRDRRRTACAQARRTLRRRDGWIRLRRDDSWGARSSARCAGTRGLFVRPVVLPDRRGVSRAARSPRVRRSTRSRSSRVRRPLPGDVVGWLETFAESFIVALSAERTSRVSHRGA